MPSLVPRLILLLGLLLQYSCMHEVTVPEVGAATAQPSDAEEWLQQGMTLLHHFEYEAAADSFRAMQRTYPDDVMGYWGEAMTYNHPMWLEQDLAAAQAVLVRLGGSPESRLDKANSDRERGLLAAVEKLFFGDADKHQRDMEYKQAMAELAQAYPDDMDIVSLHALSIMGTSHAGRDGTIYAEAEKILQAAFKQAPRHPGVLHYLIHSVDDPASASRGLTAARIYAGLAPNSANALHMPTHIYTHLGMWQESNDLNTRSLQLALRRSEQKQQELDIDGNHAMRWLTYGHLQQGHTEQANELVQQARRLHASGELSPMLLMYLESLLMLESGQWQQAFTDVDANAGDTVSRDRFIGDFVRGMQQVQLGDLEQALAHRAAMQQQIGLLEQAGQETGGERVLLHETDALIAMRKGKHEQALVLMNKATALEEATPHGHGPIWPIKPAWELLGEILLEQQKYSAAVTAFETSLKRFPGRRLSLVGLFTANSELCEVQASVELDVVPAL